MFNSLCWVSSSVSGEQYAGMLKKKKWEDLCGPYTQLKSSEVKDQLTWNQYQPSLFKRCNIKVKQDIRSHLDVILTEGLTIFLHFVN